MRPTGNQAIEAYVPSWAKEKWKWFGASKKGRQFTWRFSKQQQQQQTSGKQMFALSCRDNGTLQRGLWSPSLAEFSLSHIEHIFCR